jgi:hypothetical protein
LACGACRAEARAAAADPYAVPPATPGSSGASREEIAVRRLMEPPPVNEVAVEQSPDAHCRDRSRTRGGAGPHRHRERTDVRTLAARVADLERRLQELRPGP